MVACWRARASAPRSGITASLSQPSNSRTWPRSASSRIRVSSAAQESTSIIRSGGYRSGSGNGLGRDDLGRSGAPRRGRADEVTEQWLRPVRPGLELGVVLAGHEPGVVGQLDHLDQPLVLVRAGDVEPLGDQLRAVLVVDLVA